ncbi:hypothetical protein C0J52_10740 [Blattella germanica]|nr:hypothetical protein C0J52_10740 [Blattella germanica]
MQLSTDKLETGRNIKSFYFGYSNISNETLPQFIKMTTDLYFGFPAHETAKLQALLSTSPIYLYQFAFDGQYGSLEVEGTPQGEELGYLFAFESLISLNLSLADTEVQTSYDFVKMWTDFAKTGNPTPDDQLNLKWLPYNNEEHYCLLIDGTLTLAKDIDKDRMDFCEGLYNRR